MKKNLLITDGKDSHCQKPICKISALVFITMPTDILLKTVEYCVLNYTCSTSVKNQFHHKGSFNFLVFHTTCKVYEGSSKGDDKGRLHDSHWTVGRNTGNSRKQGHSILNLVAVSWQCGDSAHRRECDCERLSAFICQP